MPEDTGLDERGWVSRLRDPAEIRVRCRLVYERALAGRASYFAIDESKLGAAVQTVREVTEQAYPDLRAVPVHGRYRHFETGGDDRVGRARALLEKRGVDGLGRARALTELVVTSVLLDAGAGDAWGYVDPHSGARYVRSEGLAVASYDAFEAGAFSSDSAGDPLRADAGGLQSFSPERLAKAFQVSEKNPLVGLDGRAGLLRSLGGALRAKPEYFGAENPRVGNLVDALVREAGDARVLEAKRVLRAVLEAFGSIWPGRVTLAGENMGDVWALDELRDEPRAAPGGLVPFHKLSQWLTYSLLEPLGEAGLRVTDLDALTGLPEYRNGGLFVDSGVLTLKNPDEYARAHAPGSGLVVTWRALTVTLLDRVAEALRMTWGLSAEELPLAKVLQGGTWSAGRKLAQRRAGGGSPIAIVSDGTVF